MAKKKEPNIFQKRKSMIDAASGWEEPTPTKKAPAVKKPVKKPK